MDTGIGLIIRTITVKMYRMINYNATLENILLRLEEPQREA